MAAADRSRDRSSGRAGDRAGDRAIVRDGIGLGAAVGIFGLSFGALAVGAGLSTAQACVLSLAMFTGGSQLAYVTVLGAGGGAGAAAASALLLGSRNALYGVALGPVLRLRGLVRPVAAHWVIDETTAMATAAAAGPVGPSPVTPDPVTASPVTASPVTADPVAPDPVTVGEAVHRGRLAFTVTGAAVFACWNLATLAGALLGHAVADPGVLGLDAVGPAAFLALLWPRLRGPASGPARRVATVGAVLALAGALTLPTGLAIPVSALAVLAAGVRS